MNSTFTWTMSYKSILGLHITFFFKLCDSSTKSNHRSCVAGIDLYGIVHVKVEFIAALKIWILAILGRLVCRPYRTLESQ